MDDSAITTVAKLMHATTAAPTERRAPRVSLSNPSSTTGEELLYGNDLGPGAQTGGYVIEELHSRGGFASVYRVRHATLGRRVALKVMHRYLAASPSMLRRFQQEARAVNLIRHPNIVDIYECGELTDGRPFLVMEWLDGRNLEQEIQARGPLSPAETLAIAEELGSALSAVHRRGIIHRDVKALNVMLVPAGDWSMVKLIDFGIAKLLDDDGVEASATGVQVGTPWNMAPEQIRCADVDARTDIYAFGGLIFQMLTARLPFFADAPHETELLQLEGERPRVSDFAPVPDGVDDVVRRCLEPEPARRYATVDEMLRELRCALSRSCRHAGLNRCNGIGLAVETRLDDSRTAIPDEVLSHLGRVLDESRRALCAAQLTPAIDAAGVVFGVGVLSEDESLGHAARVRVLDEALALRDRLREIAGARSPVRWAITVHCGSLVVRAGAEPAEAVAGDLLALADWANPEFDGEVVASERALEDLDGLVARPAKERGFACVGR